MRAGVYLYKDKKRIFPKKILMNIYIKKLLFNKLY